MYGKKCKYLSVIIKREISGNEKDRDIEKAVMDLKKWINE